MTLLFVLCSLPLLAFASEWSYDKTSTIGPANWYQTFPVCGGAMQSPIDILTRGVQRQGDLVPLDFVKYDKVSSTAYTLLNNGHSFQVTMPDNTVRVQRGGLRAQYALEQFHFHWGRYNNKGSEHLVDGVAHALELHLVHYDVTKYNSVSAALADPEGVAVLGIFVDVASEGSDRAVELGRLTSNFIEVPYGGNSTTTKPFAISALLPRSKQFYRYRGSLTTPPCSEAVVWTFFTNPIYITGAQMDTFRTLHTNEGALLPENFRPPQPLGNRRVTLSSN